MKFFTIFLLTIIICVLGLPTFGESGIIQNQVVISSSEQAFVIAPATNPDVMVYYMQGDQGGATSIRFEKNKIIEDNKYPADSRSVFGNRTIYGDTYKQRDRDLGQTFLTDDKGFTVDAVYLRVGPNEVKQNTPGARVAIQFFKVTGQPYLNDHGTPGFIGKFDRQTSPELDDYLEGESYKPIYVATGKLPSDLKKDQYMKWQLEGKPLTLEPHTHYAFMIMFLDRDEDRSLSLYNNYYGNYYPDLTDLYVGHGIRREGKANFPDQWEDRLSMQPGTLGFPDVCTFRDLFFVITKVVKST